VTLRPSEEVCLLAPHTSLFLDREQDADKLADATANEPKEHMRLALERTWLIMRALCIYIVNDLEHLF